MENLGPPGGHGSVTRVVGAGYFEALVLGSPPRFSGMKTVPGSGWTLSGGGGAGCGVGLSAMTSGYRERERPQDGLQSECEHRALEHQLERVDRRLVGSVAVAGTVGDPQLRLGWVVE